MSSAFIIDDEKKNRESLRKLLNEFCPVINVIGEAASVSEALELFSKKKPDLVFLDVEMPNGTGFDLLRQLGPINFKVIFVTAHSHYAIKAIKYSAIDYLLKPIDTDDLILAVNRALEISKIDSSMLYKELINNVDDKSVKRLAIPIRDGFAFISPSEIIRLQADGTYTHIYTSAEKYTAAKNILEYEKILSDKNFFRSHNSHLINLHHVRKFSRLDGYFVQMSDGSTAEISRRRKEEFIEIMSKH